MRRALIGVVLPRGLPVEHLHQASSVGDHTRSWDTRWEMVLLSPCLTQHYFSTGCKELGLGSLHGGVPYLGI